MNININETKSKTVAIASLILIIFGIPFSEIYGQDKIPIWRDTTDVWEKGITHKKFEVGDIRDGIRAILYVSTPKYLRRGYRFLLAQRYTLPSEVGYNPTFEGEKGLLPTVSLAAARVSLNGNLWIQASLGMLAPQFSLTYPEASLLESMQTELHFNSGLILKKTVQFEAPTRFGPSTVENIRIGATLWSGNTLGAMAMDCRTKGTSESIVQQIWSLYNEDKSSKTLLQKVDYFTPTYFTRSSSFFLLKHIYKERLAKTGKIPTKVDLEFVCITDLGTEYRSEYTLDIIGYDPTSRW